jgi:hypothetical protein
MDNELGKEDRSISLLWANVIGIGAAIPLYLGGILLFEALWGDGAYDLDVGLWAVAIGLVGIVVHELLHGMTWQLVAGASRDLVEYGVKWQVLTPYAHLKAPIPARPYRWGAFMPGLILGLLPLAVGLASGNTTWLNLGLFFTWAASGDFTVLWLLRDVGPHRRVEDHPERAGAYVLPPQAKQKT